VLKIKVKTGGPLEEIMSEVQVDQETQVRRRRTSSFWLPLSFMMAVVIIAVPYGMQAQGGGAPGGRGTHAVIEMGGRGAVKDETHRVTESPIRGFWSYWAELMGVEAPDGIR